MRLIDAEPIEKHIQDGLNQRREESFGYVGAQIMNEIRCAPTIDAVEVIRCRDCKYMRGSKLNDSKWCAIYGNDFGWGRVGNVLAAKGIVEKNTGIKMKNYKDYNIKIHDIWAHDDELGEYIGIEWSAQNIGFGQLQINIDENGDFTFDKEYMNDEFCNAIVRAMADKLFPIT